MKTTKEGLVAKYGKLITKEEQRTKAIQSVASNFKDMATGINQLNESLSESMRISRLYD